MKKINKSKKAKFFCENCGAEVPQNAKFCRNCGRFFASVRCPACEYVGMASAFTNGCPNCGYADFDNDHNGHSSSLSSHESNRGSNSKNSNDSPLPVWIYFASIVALIGMIVAVVYNFAL